MTMPTTRPAGSVPPPPDARPSDARRGPDAGRGDAADERGRAALRALGLNDGADLTGETMDIVSPLTGSPIGRVPRLGPDDVDRAVQRARTAQRRWARTPMRERSRVLLALHDLVWRLRNPLLDLVPC